MKKIKYWAYVKYFFIINLLLMGTTDLVAQPVTLTELGAVLRPMTVNPENVTLNMQVALNDEQPVRTFVTAHTASGSVLQRNNLSYWVPWSGKLTDLTDNFNTVDGTHLTFKILKDENMSNELFPIRVTIAYETSSAFKFGVFELVKRHN